MPGRESKDDDFLLCNECSHSLTDYSINDLANTGDQFTCLKQAPEDREIQTRGNRSVTP